MKLFCIALLLIFTDDPVSLFDGKSFTGWKGDTETTWRIENQTIVAGSLKKPAARNEFLTTKKTFEDFELTLKFKTEGKTKINAGVQFRTKRIPNHHEVIGYQADIGEGVHGALYDESRRRKFLAKPDEETLTKAKQAKPENGWESYRVLAQGDRIQIWLNGVMTVDFKETDKTIPRSGVIALQIHGKMQGTIAYKDIKIRELKK